MARKRFVVFCHTCDEFIDTDIPCIFEAREVRDNHADGSCSISILQEIR